MVYKLTARHCGVSNSGSAKHHVIIISNNMMSSIFMEVFLQFTALSAMLMIQEGCCSNKDNSVDTIVTAFVCTFITLSRANERNGDSIHPSTAHNKCCVFEQWEIILLPFSSTITYMQGVRKTFNLASLHMEYCRWAEHTASVSATVMLTYLYVIPWGTMGDILSNQHLLPLTTGGYQ